MPRKFNRVLSWVFLVALFVACRAPASKLPANVVLSFGVSHMGTSSGFVVNRDGSATSSSHGPDGLLETQGQVNPDELAHLERVFDEHDCCSFVSSGATRVPDEARPSFSVRLGAHDCRVTLNDNEFHDDDDAKACLAAVEALGRKLRERSQPPPG